MSAELAPVMIMLLPFLGAVLIPILNLFLPRLVPFFAVAVGLVSAVMALYLPGAVAAGASYSVEWLPGVLSTGLLLDALSMVPALIATWIGFLVLVYSLGYMKHEENLARYYSLVLLFIGSMVGMSLADNFITLFFFWEVMGVCSYLLIGFFYRDPKAAAAGTKAFMVTRIGDIGLFAAILSLYTVSGTFSIPQNLAFVAQTAVPVIGLIAFGFILGAVGKSAQVPLHVWLPDAMEAPTTISALIHAATMVNAGVYLLARVYPILEQAPGALVAVQWIGALTAITGALLAVFHQDLKRILAYSTVSQLGYMVMAVGVGGVFASQFHLLSHALFKALLFLCAGAVIHELGSRDIRDMGGLKKDMPLTAVTFLVGALALMGLPVLNGFFSKDLILEAAYHHHATGPLVLAVAAAVLTAFYSLRTTYAVFWGPRHTGRHLHEAPAVMTMPLLLLALASLVSWLLIGPLTSAWERTGLDVHVTGWLGLVRETFSSPAFLMTALAILTGFGLFMARRSIGALLREKFPSVFPATAAGFGFDLLYGWIVGFVYVIGRLLRNFWEAWIMEGINIVAGRLSLAASVVSRQLQTGDVHWNLLYIILTLIIVLRIIL